MVPCATDPNASPPRTAAVNSLTPALDFFSRKGFQGTTTKEIAGRRRGPEALFQALPSKQAPLPAVLDYQYESGEIDALLTRWKALWTSMTTPASSVR